MVLCAVCVVYTKYVYKKLNVYWTTCAYYQFIFIFIPRSFSCAFLVPIVLCAVCVRASVSFPTNFGHMMISVVLFLLFIWLRHAFKNSIVWFLFYILFILFLITCHWILNSFVCIVHQKMLLSLSLLYIYITGTNGIVVIFFSSLLLYRQYIYL